MFRNVLLEEKWKTQKKLAKEADYDIGKMMDNTDKIVQKMMKEHKSKLTFANLKPDTKINLSD
ncbi:MAG: hypothetical protein H8E57_01365 [Candidatus Cloacimonetes bacterium]|nr:hypothetical protein [Candidatus Cloacimonadota bacterium]